MRVIYFELSLTLLQVKWFSCIINAGKKELKQRAKRFQSIHSDLWETQLSELYAQTYLILSAHHSVKPFQVYFSPGLNE